MSDGVSTMAKQRLFIHTIDVTFERLRHQREDIFQSRMFLDKSEEEKKSITDAQYEPGHVKTHRVVSERSDDAVNYVLFQYQRRGVSVRNYEISRCETDPVDAIIHIATHESGFSDIFG
jgi:hypothetical protein